MKCASVEELVNTYRYIKADSMGKVQKSMHESKELQISATQKTIQGEQKTMHHWGCSQMVGEKITHFIILLALNQQ